MDWKSPKLDLPEENRYVIFFLFGDNRPYIAWYDKNRKTFRTNCGEACNKRDVDCWTYINDPRK